VQTTGESLEIFESECGTLVFQGIISIAMMGKPETYYPDNMDSAPDGVKDIYNNV
jgi:hypothetical protein